MIIRRCRRQRHAMRSLWMLIALHNVSASKALTSLTENVFMLVVGASAGLFIIIIIFTNEWRFKMKI